ncbi:MAG: STAS domain-containing protein [Phycisphaerae bacterium]|jgi:anti-anti-sigma factor
MSVERRGSTGVVSFQQNSILDTVSIQNLSRQLYELVDAGETPRLLIDFTNVRFLSSQALGVLLTLRRKADKSGTQVAFAGLRPELQRVFQVTKLDTMFAFYEGVPEALAAFGEESGDNQPG